MFRSGEANGSFWFTKSAIGTRNGLRIRVFGTNGSLEWYQQECELLRMCDISGDIKSIDRASECVEATKPRYERMKAGHPSGFIEAFSNIYEDIYEEYQAHKYQDKKNHIAAQPSKLGLELAWEGLRFFEESVELSNKQ